MLANMMWSLASQQRRLMSGQKHISFSREQGGVVRAHASSTTTEQRSGRRRRRPTEAAQSQQQHDHTQNQQQQQPQLDERAVKQASNSSSRRSSRSDPERSHAREQFLQQAACLGVMRASDLEGRPRKPRVSELPWSASPTQQQPGPDSSSSSSPASSVSALSDSTLSSSSSSSNGSQPEEGSSSRGSDHLSHQDSTISSEQHSASHNHTSSSSSEDAPSPDTTTSSSSSSERGISLQLSEQEEAIIAATNRLSRFLDFRERCASEVVTKLIEVGYDRQFAHTVLEHMQDRGLQDDARFAEIYARGQWTAKAAAPSKIAYELRSRQVAQRHIDAALTAVFGDSREVARREPSDEQQEASWDKLVAACRQRVEATQGYPQQKRRAKLATWLQRRGHSLATAFRMFEVLGI